MLDTRTFAAGIGDAIHLLSTKVPTTLGRYCSSATLADVAAPTMTQRLYISVLEDHLQDEGSYADGIRFAVDLLASKRVDRIPDLPCEWGLADTDNPSVGNQLYMSALEGLIGPAG